MGSVEATSHAETAMAVMVPVDANNAMNFMLRDLRWLGCDYGPGEKPSGSPQTSQYSAP